MIKDIQEKNLILFGCGAVQKCVLHYIDKYFKFDPNKIIFFDSMFLIIYYI